MKNLLLIVFLNFFLKVTANASEIQEYPRSSFNTPHLTRDIAEYLVLEHLPLKSMLVLKRASTQWNNVINLELVKKKFRGMPIFSKLSPSLTIPDFLNQIFKPQIEIIEAPSGQSYALQGMTPDGKALIIVCSRDLEHTLHSSPFQDNSFSAMIYSNEKNTFSVENINEPFDAFENTSFIYVWQDAVLKKIGAQDKDDNFLAGPEASQKDLQCKFEASMYLEQRQEEATLRWAAYETGINNSLGDSEDSEDSEDFDLSELSFKTTDGTDVKPLMNLNLVAVKSIALNGTMVGYEPYGFPTHPFIYRPGHSFVFLNNIFPLLCQTQDANTQFDALSVNCISENSMILAGCHPPHIWRAYIPDPESLEHEGFQSPFLSSSKELEMFDQLGSHSGKGFFKEE